MSGEGARLKEALEKVTGVKNVSRSDKGESSLFDVEVLPGNDVRRELGKAVSEAGGDILELFGGKTTIEDVFVRITTREG